MATLSTPVFHLPYPDGDELVSNADAAFSALALSVEAAMNPTWTAITPAAGYSARVGYFAPAYRVFGDGRVELRGAMTKSTAIVTGDTLFTLATGARPTAQVALAAVVNRSDATKSPAAKITIATSGVATVEVIDSQGPLSIVFDGTSFTKS